MSIEEEAKKFVAKKKEPEAFHCNKCGVWSGFIANVTTTPRGWTETINGYFCPKCKPYKKGK